MMKACRTSVAGGALVAPCLLLLATVALGATRIHYSGRTSQQRRISFTISGGYVQNLQYHVDDRCRGGKLLFVHDFDFPPMRITHLKSGGKPGSNSGSKSSGRFGGSFVATGGIATARLQGQTAGETVSGSLSDRSENARTHRFCTGKATFRLTHE